MNPRCQKCPRPASVGPFCRIHQPAEKMNIQLFHDTVLAEWNDASLDKLDLSRIEYNGSWDFLKGEKSDKEIVLDSAHLETCLELNGITCTGLSLKDVLFKGGLYLKDLEIQGTFDLVNSKIHGGVFKLQHVTVEGDTVCSPQTCQSHFQIGGDCKFEGKTDFGKGQFEASVNIKDSFFGKEVSFDEAKLHSGFNASNVTFQGPLVFTPLGISSGPHFNKVDFLGESLFTKEDRHVSSATFQNCRLDGVRFLTIREPKVAEIKDCTWPRKPTKPFLRSRFRVADEYDRSNSLELAQLYRKLHKKYYEESNFKYSSDFYVGFMTMNRRTSRTNKVSWFCDLFYAVVSKYGESVRRPLLGLGLMWFLIPFALMFLGLPQDAARPSDLTTWSWFHPDGTFFLWYGDYWYGFVYNLASSTLFRGTGSVQPTFTLQFVIIFVETILNILLIGFTAVGIRRQFVPKKPMD